MTELGFIKSFKDIIDDYDVFIFDLWGVMYDGVNLFPKAVETLRTLRTEHHKKCYFLSNAPRRIDSVMEKLSNMELSPDEYDGILTSGEATYRGLMAFANDNGGLAHYYHMGPQRDRGIFDRLDLIEVDDIADAQFIVNTGILDFAHGIEEYQDILDAAHAKNMPMICANPDKIVMIEGKQVVCAGLLAEYYQEHGGNVVFYGKPHNEVFEQLFTDFNIQNKGRTIMIGDSLETDIIGACGAGIPSVWVYGSGIFNQHIEQLSTSFIDENGVVKKQLDPNRVKELFDDYGCEPRYIIKKVCYE